jgi:hypothetical protein
MKYVEGKLYWLYKAIVTALIATWKREDIHALADAREVKRQRTLEQARAVVSTRATSCSPVPTRMAIAGDVKMFVCQRDGGARVECGSKEELEFDDVIPLSMGASPFSDRVTFQPFGVRRNGRHRPRIWPSSTAGSSDPAASPNSTISGPWAPRSSRTSQLPSRHDQR